VPQRIATPTLGDNGDVQPFVGADRQFGIPTGATLTGLFLTLATAPSGGTCVVEVRTAASGGGSALTATFADGEHFATATGSIDVSLLSSLYLRPTSANGAAGLSGSITLDGGDNLTTLARVRSLGGRVLGAQPLQPPAFTADALDALIWDVIGSVSAQIKNYVRRDLTQRTYTAERYDHSGRSHVLQLRQFPLISVAALSVDGVALAGTDYSFDDREKALGQIIYTPNSATVPSCWPSGTRHISVTYTAGLAAVPADLQDACVIQVLWVLQRLATNRVGVRSTVIEAGGTQTFMVDAWAPEAAALLEPYREVLL
jgi:hypothetical protein